MYHRGVGMLQRGDPGAAAVLDGAAPRLGPEMGAAARWLAAIARNREGGALRPPAGAGTATDAMGRAVLAAMSGDLDRAQSELGRASDPPMIASAVRVAIVRDDEAMARALTERVERLAPGSAWALVARAAVAMDLDGDPVTARRLQRQAVAQAPDNVWFLNDLSLIEVALDHPIEAEAALRHALEIEPDDALLLGNLAIVLMNTERIEEARAIATGMLAADPGSFLALRVLGRAALQSSDPEAERLLLQALAAQPAAAETSLLLASAAQMRGDRVRARQELEAAARLDPNQPIVPMALSVFALDSHEVDTAIIEARRAEALLTGQNRTGARIAADRNTGTPLANAYTTIGLDAWARFANDRSFDPLSANSLFTEVNLSRPFAGRESFAAYEDFESSLINGLLLDPLSASYRLRFVDLIRRPFLDVGVTLSGDKDGGSGALNVQGLTRLPAPLAYSLNLSEVRSDAPPGETDSWSGTLLAGMKLGARGGIFAVASRERETEDITQPLGFGLSDAFGSEDTSETVGLGLSYRLSGRSILKFYAEHWRNDVGLSTRSHVAPTPASLFRFDGHSRGRTTRDRVSLGWQSEDGSGFWSAGLDHVTEVGRVDSWSEVTDLITGDVLRDQSSDDWRDRSWHGYVGRRQYFGQAVTVEGLLEVARLNGETRAGGRLGLAWSPGDGQWLRGAAFSSVNPYAESLAPATVLGLVPLRFPFDTGGKMQGVILRYDAEINERLLLGAEAQYLELWGLDYDTSFASARARAATAMFEANWWIGDGVGLKAAILHASSRVSGGPDHGAPLPEMPEWTAVLGLGWLKPSGFGGAVQARWTSERYSGVPTAPLKPVLSIDGQLSWESRDKRLLATLEFNNLLDARIGQPWGARDTRREVRLSLTARF